MIYFVGMHNKPGFAPLDSRTYTGKIIDEVIKRVGEAKKTNLSDAESLPKDHYQHCMRWLDKNEPHKGDIIVLLGQWVQKNFWVQKPDFYFIEVPHPSAFEARRDKWHYIAFLSNSIIRAYESQKQVLQH